MGCFTWLFCYSFVPCPNCALILQLFVDRSKGRENYNPHVLYLITTFLPFFEPVGVLTIDLEFAWIRQSMCNQDFPFYHASWSSSPAL